MRWRYFCFPRQVRNCPRYAQYALVRPRRQVEPLGRILKQCPARPFNRTGSRQFRSFKARIGYSSALHLAPPRSSNAFRDGITVCTARLDLA